MVFRCNNCGVQQDTGDIRFSSVCGCGADLIAQSTSEVLNRMVDTIVDEPERHFLGTFRITTIGSEPFDMVVRRVIFNGRGTPLFLYSNYTPTTIINFANVTKMERL